MLDQFNFYSDCLICPVCKSGFSLLNFSNTKKGEIYGILRCECNYYPVVDGIPILKENIHKDEEWESF